MRTIAEQQDECRNVNKKLPSKALKEIERTTGMSYNFIYRTMNGDFKLKWDDRHEKVLKAAKAILKRV